ncbi:MAG TPA: response regulator [Elusimicrobiota bacterium]|nr:response regulator [Elusimicrobiota bacterium]
MARRRILIIDDDDAFRTIVREALGKQGYEIREAANGREALAQVGQFQPELVLLDVMMPDMDGVTLCRELRAVPTMKDVPVLMVSALGDNQTTNDALLFGATDYVVKPVELAQLRAKIDKAFQESENRRRMR